MATDKKNAPGIDSSDLIRYPNGRIKDDTGSGDGTPVNRLIYGDIHEFFAKIMRLSGIDYNGLPDNEANGYQLVQAMSALAGKNDFIYTANLLSGIVNIDLDISILKENECLLCRSTFDIDTDTVTTIKGTKPSTYTITVPSQFKTSDYLLLVKTSSGITIQRLADANNINAIAAEFDYLKGAIDLEEFAGATTTKATTPYTNQLAVARRVIGLDSHIFLATNLRNGLLSKEDKIILNSIGANPIKNQGWVGGININGNTPGVGLPTGGNISSATCLANEAVTLCSEYKVLFQNPMADTNYFVRISIESQTSPNNTDAYIFMPVYRNKTTNDCTIILRKSTSVAQNVKLYIEVIQLA